MSELNSVAVQAVPADDLNGKYLTFQIEDAFYGIELIHVIEIISIQSITRVPHVPNYMKGIINLRGKIIPVLDVRLKFGQQERAYDDKTCIVVISINDTNVGLIVDNVSEVVSIDGMDLSTLPEFNKVNINRYLKSINKANGRMVLNIDCEKFLYDDMPPPLF